MRIQLQDIPGLVLGDKPLWRVKILSINGKQPALDALVKWKREEPRDYKKIIASIKIAAGTHRVANKKRVKKTTNPKQGDIYEFRADKLHARLFFFYDDEETLIICTNDYWKNKGSQDAAFEICAGMKAVYEQRERKKYEI